MLFRLKFVWSCFVFVIDCFTIVADRTSSDRGRALVQGKEFADGRSSDAAKMANKGKKGGNGE